MSEQLLWRAVLCRAFTDATDPTKWRGSPAALEQTHARNWLLTPSLDLFHVAVFAGYELEVVLDAAAALRDKGWPALPRLDRNPLIEVPAC